MKIVFWLVILVVMLNLLVGDARVGYILAVFWDQLSTLRMGMILLGATILTSLMMSLLFSDFSDHVLPKPREDVSPTTPEKPSEAPAPTK